MGKFDFMDSILANNKDLNDDEFERKDSQIESNT